MSGGLNGWDGGGGGGAASDPLFRFEMCTVRRLVVVALALALGALATLEPVAAAELGRFPRVAEAPV